jgi:hypothetical protein
MQGSYSSELSYLMRLELSAKDELSNGAFALAPIGFTLSTTAQMRDSIRLSHQAPG